MKLKHVLVANAVLSALFALNFLLAPAMQYATFGAQTSALAEAIGRSFGASLLGWAVVSWFSRNIGLSPARTGIVVGSIAFHLLGATNMMFAVMAGVVNAIGWVVVVVHILVPLGLALTHFERSQATTASV